MKHRASQVQQCFSRVDYSMALLDLEPLPEMASETGLHRMGALGSGDGGRIKKRGTICPVTRIRQRARSGAKGYVVPVDGGPEQALWVEGKRFEDGPLVIFIRYLGNDEHYREEVSYVGLPKRALSLTC